jgi:iron(III) transport system substrate-binding protein
MKQAMPIILAVFVIVLFALDESCSGAAETAGPILAKLNKLPAEQRQKILVEKAKAEGEVAFYSSLQAQQIEPFIQDFRSKYPFIKVNSYRVSGNKQVLKIQAELNAGRNLFDVTNGSAEQAFAMRQIGALDPYDSPQRAFYPGENKEGYFTSLYIIPLVLGYNTNLLKANDAPKNYEALLDPKWKGQMFLDNEAYEWLAVMEKHLGREKALAYMKSLVKQDIRLTRGRTAQTQLIVAGERPIGVVLSGHTVLDLRAAGAPISLVTLDPYFAQANKLMLARHAPHPHAAQLFIDWALSEEAQAIITSFGRVVARKSVKQRFPELMEKDPFLVDVDFLGPILDRVGKEFTQIFLKN